MTIGPDGSVTLAGYSLAEALRMAQDREFRRVLREAREKPSAEAEVRELRARG
jgi:hypothetical protein